MREPNKGSYPSSLAVSHRWLVLTGEYVLILTIAGAQFIVVFVSDMIRDNPLFSAGLKDISFDLIPSPLQDPFPDILIIQLAV